MKLATFRIARRALALCLTAAAAPAIAQFPPLVTLENPSSVERVRFDCPGYGVYFSESLAGIGDINADGIDDFAICAPYSSAPGLSYCGACFVYFGGAWTANTASIDVTALDGTNGFVVLGEENNDAMGSGVQGAGDVNGDGIDDLLILGPGINDAAGVSRGAAMVLFGRPGIGSSGTVLASSLDGSNGFRVIGPVVPAGMPGGGQVGACAAIGDVNHDGFADLAFSSSGWGVPANSITMLPGVSRGITSADFDGDGDTDFVVSHETQNKFTLYRNQGGGIFSPLAFVSHTLPRKVLAADVDNDGDIDLVFDTQQNTAPNQHRITVVKNIAGGLFGTGVDYLVTGAENADFDLGDLNGDGFVDIVAVSYTYPTGTPRDLVTLINNQSGGFTVGQTLLPPNSPHHVRVGDLDGDGDLDVAVFQLDPKRLKFFSNDGTGTLTPVGTGPGMLLTSPGFVGGFELGDLDGDGDLDVLGSSSVASVLLNNGGFSFTPGAQVDMVNTPTGPLLYDFDGDGDLDAWIGAYNVDESRAFNLLVNSGNGTFESTRRCSAPLGTITRGTLMDFDGDGRIDVVCVGEVYGSPSTVVLLHNNGDGTFDGAHRGRAWVVYGAATFAAPGDVLLDGLNGSNGFRMDGRASNEAFGGALGGAGDFDADGIDDFAVGAGQAWMGGPLPGSAFVVRGAAGLGAGGVLDLHTASAASVFRVDNPSPGTYFPSTFSSGDLDGDGIDDLALGAIDASNGLGMGGMYVLFGAAGLGNAGPISLASPDGMFAVKLQELYAGLGMGESGAIVGDINADGHRDLIAGMIKWPYNGFLEHAGQALVLYGQARPFASGVIVGSTLNGTNGFTLQGDQQAHAYFGETVADAGDVDHDGVDDLLVGEPGWDLGATGSELGRAWLVLGGKYRAPQTYCTSKTSSLGCVPSIGWTGALPSVTDPDPFVITSTNTINQRFGLLFYSAAGRGSTPFLGGTLCVQTPLRRTPIASSGGNLAPDDCSGVFTFDWRAWMDSGSDPSLTAGTTVDAQFWSRDPPSSFAVNLSDALEFTIDP